MRFILTLPGSVVVLNVFTSSPSRPFLFLDEAEGDENVDIAFAIVLVLCSPHRLTIIVSVPR